MWYDMELADPLADQNPRVNPERQVIEAELSIKMNNAIMRLSEKQQMAISETYFNNLSHAEAAERMGVSVDTLKAHLRMSKFRLLLLFGEAAFAQLPLHEVHILRLHLAGKSYKSIAKTHGYVGPDGKYSNISAVEKRVRRTKKFLFRWITSENGA